MKALFRKKSVMQIVQAAEAGELADVENHHGLKRVLGVRDLTLMGIAAVVGAGIFSTIGAASYDGGPGIVLLFIFVALACGFSAMCYAEFASMVPVSGSAYTYSYVAFGEVIAWIIGWDLLMEYAIGNIAVAISWSDYFTSLVNNIHIGSWHPHIPAYLTMDYWTAQHAFYENIGSHLGSIGLKAAPAEASEAAIAYFTAPALPGGLRLICDLPAFMITALITWVCYVGIKESKRTANILVGIKLGVILLVIAAGAFYVQPENWSPFLPNGLKGVMAGTAAVFFSYIGFDAISTTAEECRNPRRDLPRSMFYALIICTVIYILVALVLTGMANYKTLNVGDPLAHAFRISAGDASAWLAGIISVSAVVATASVLLVFQLGQPRIWMSMSRDGLLPGVFSKVHPKYKTPSFSTILTGVVVGVPALFMNLEEVVNLTSVGTLFAFVLVCGGIIRLQHSKNRPASAFRTPYISGRWIVPLLFVTTLFLISKYVDGGLRGFLSGGDDGTVLFSRDKILYLLFLIVFAGTAVYSFLKRWSLIPVLGFLCCSYLLCESGTTNWERFLLWLLVGLVIYFLYGYKHSRLGQMPMSDEETKNQ